MRIETRFGNRLTHIARKIFEYSVAGPERLHMSASDLNRTFRRKANSFRHGAKPRSLPNDSQCNLWRCRVSRWLLLRELSAVPLFLLLLLVINWRQGQSACS